MTVRLLRPGDEPAIEAFLVPRIDTSLFLLSNLAAAGLVDRGQTYGGTWIGAGDPLGAIAVHAWNGFLLVQGDEGLEEAARAAVVASGRTVDGISGPAEAVERARVALGLPAVAWAPEVLYALPLEGWVAPALPGAVRPPADDEVEGLLVEWRRDYLLEALGLRETRDGVRPGLRRLHADRRHWVLEVDGRPVAYATWNAAAHGTVQIGGVWTPPALRGRGYGRAVVAGALVEAQARGMNRTVLFTAAENTAARRAYEALGYRAIGHYGLWLPRPGPT